MENQKICNNNPAHHAINKNALLLGKDKALQEMMACLLSEMGLNCKSCYPEDYHELFRQLKPVFIIIDCTLQSEENQYASITHHLAKPVPIILLSPYPALKPSYKSNTNYIFLEKPFNLKEFTGSVKKLLGKQAMNNIKGNSFL